MDEGDKTAKDYFLKKLAEYLQKGNPYVQHFFSKEKDIENLYKKEILSKLSSTNSMNF